MTNPLTISDLRAFKLTQDEWHALAHISDFEQDRDCMDMLVLAGLAGGSTSMTSLSDGN